MLLLATFLYAAEGGAPRSNLEVIDSLIAAGFDSAAAFPCPHEGNDWAFSTEAAGEKGQMLRSAFYSFVASGHGTIHSGSPREMRVELFDVHIVYAESSFWGGWNSELFRRIELRLKGSLACGGAGGRVVPFDTVYFLQDTLKQGDLPAVEAGAYSFLKGRRASYNVWEQWVEPALVTLSLSAVVYLFFTIRS